MFLIPNWTRKNCQHTLQSTFALYSKHVNTITNFNHYIIIQITSTGKHRIIKNNIIKIETDWKVQVEKYENKQLFNII